MNSKKIKQVLGTAAGFAASGFFAGLTYAQTVKPVIGGIAIIGGLAIGIESARQLYKQ